MPAPTNGIFFRSRKKQTPAKMLPKPIRMNTGSWAISLSPWVSSGLTNVHVIKNTMNNPNNVCRTGMPRN